MRLIKKILKNQKGFSLVELMVVVSIISILFAIATPQYQKYIRRSKQTEAKLLLAAIYTYNTAFNAEWGYSTSNFIQMGFGTQGDLNYRTGFNALGTVDPGSWIQSNTLPTSLSDYDGPPVPTGKGSLINTKDFCDDTSYGGGCLYLPTSTITLPTNAKIDNSEKYNPTFKAMAIGDLGGSQNDEWELDVTNGSKVITHNKSGL